MQQLIKILKTATIITFCSITLKGEYGVPVWADVFFRLFGASFLHTILSLLVISTLLYLLYTVIKPNQNLKMHIIGGFILVAYLFAYANQAQSHVDPFDLSESFIWTVLLFLGLLIATIILLFNTRKKTGNTIFS